MRSTAVVLDECVVESLNLADGTKPIRGLKALVMQDGEPKGEITICTHDLYHAFYDYAEGEGVCTDWRMLRGMEMAIRPSREEILSALEDKFPGRLIVPDRDGIVRAVSE